MTSRLMIALCWLAAALCLLPLFAVLGYVVVKGLPGLSLAFFIRLPAPVGAPGGGMANAIIGTLTLVGLASLMAIPAGILAGIYLSEFGRGRTASAVRFGSDILAGLPSIVVGLFAFTLLVLPMKRFSGLAGSVALAILMLPFVARTTEAMLRLVPGHLREAGLALGLPRWKVLLFLILPAARRGVLTGAMLAVARAAGETAPLLFTALGNQFWSRGITYPTASLPVQIFTYAITPYPELHQQAWTGALTLILLVLTTFIIARVFGARTREG